MAEWMTAISAWPAGGRMSKIHRCYRGSSRMVLYETFSQGGFWSTQNQGRLDLQQARFYMAGCSTSHRLERSFRDGKRMDAGIWCLIRIMGTSKLSPDSGRSVSFSHYLKRRFKKKVHQKNGGDLDPDEFCLRFACLEEWSSIQICPAVWGVKWPIPKVY